MGVIVGDGKGCTEPSCTNSVVGYRTTYDKLAVVLRSPRKRSCTGGYGDKVGSHTPCFDHARLLPNHSQIVEPRGRRETRDLPVPSILENRCGDASCAGAEAERLRHVFLLSDFMYHVGILHHVASASYCKVGLRTLTIANISFLLPYSAMASERIVQISMAPEPGVVPGPDEVHENEWYNQDFDGYRIEEHPIFEKRPIRMICVGAGAAGLQVAYKAERMLQNVELQIYEKNHDVGGTWLENRYPGCTCDIPSHS